MLTAGHDRTHFSYILAYSMSIILLLLPPPVRVDDLSSGLSVGTLGGIRCVGSFSLRHFVFVVHLAFSAGSFTLSIHSGCPPLWFEFGSHVLFVSTTLGL